MEHAFVYMPRCVSEKAAVAIHVLMEHAFVYDYSNPRLANLSQSTCSWNTRLYPMFRNLLAVIVAIHVLMEHAFVF